MALVAYKFFKGRPFSQPLLIQILPICSSPISGSSSRQPSLSPTPLQATNTGCQVAQAGPSALAPTASHMPQSAVP